MRLGDGRAPLDGLKGLVENLSPRDRLGLVTLPGGGPMIQPTSDHGAVLEALGPRARHGAAEPRSDAADDDERGVAHRAQPPRRDQQGRRTQLHRRRPGGPGRGPARCGVRQADDGRAVPDPHPDGGGGHRARGARPQQRVAGGDGRAARQPARRRGPQDDRLHLRWPGLRSADAGAAAAVRLARRGGRGQLLRDPALLAGRGRDRPTGMPTDADEDRNLRADGLFYLAGITGGALFRPSAGLGIVAARIARETSARYAHRLPGAGRRSGTASATRSRWRCGASAA